MPSPEFQTAQFKAALFTSTPRIWVTPTLIVVNVVIFAAMLASNLSLSPAPATVLAWGANFGPKTLHGEWWRLFAAMFLHFNILHIGLNMWALANLGQLVERLVGNVGFLLLYLVSGLLGSVASVAWNPEVIIKYYSCSSPASRGRAFRSTATYLSESGKLHSLCGWTGCLSACASAAPCPRV